MSDDRLEPAHWHRLHPLSPIVRAGRATIGIAIVLVPSVLTGRRSSGLVYELAFVGVLLGLGFVSWLVTRWRVEDDDLRIETGLIRRQSLRFPLAQVQAIDIVKPGLARVFRVAELRLRMAGNTGGTARLAYLPERDAEPLRVRLLQLAHGAVEPTARTEEREPKQHGDERVLTTVPPARLAASILLSDVGFASAAILVGLIVTAVLAPSVAKAVFGGGAVPIVGAVTHVWRRFNQEYRLTLAEAPDGLRLRSGLVALTSETIRPGRVQAVRMVEPFLWRRLGWCRLEVDLAGRQRRKGEGEAQRKQLRAVLPVGSRALAFELLERIVPAAPQAGLRPPGRVRLKSPLRYRFLGWGRTDVCVVASSGRIRRVTTWVPLAKVQSLRRTQGPLQRRLQLASVHVDTAGRSVHATLRDRDVDEADRALAELVGLAREARRAPP
ncbi:MAG: rane-flanked domain protein [Actinomycetia bacterium]|nr:rane-flanked domain protein [Actinomycetes bacterium]